MSTSSRKKERRNLRKQKNIQNEINYKKEAWKNGKLIEENHNDGYYSTDYTTKLCDRLYDILKKIKENSKDNNECIVKYRKYKNKIRDLILRWNIDLDKNEKYYYLKNSIETYWDNIDNLINIL